MIGAEAEASPVFTSSLAAGRIVTVSVKPTVADGLAGNMEPDSRTFAIVRDLADQVALVAESSIQLAMRGLFMHERLVAEGAAATAVGALLQGGLDLAGRKVGVILTGRNVDAESLPVYLAFVFAGLISTRLGRLRAGCRSRSITTWATSSGASFHDVSLGAAPSRGWLKSVSTEPGMTTLTRMFSNRTSCMSDSLKAMRPALEAQ